VLQDLVAHLVEIQQPEADNKQIELVCQMPGPPLRVYADPERLIQVITNLLTNAIHYTPPQGQITIRLEMDDDQAALIHVQDTGSGINSEHLPHIFEPFYRASSDSAGIGLGLSISREIVELHGGQLSAASEAGQGSCFTIRLPLLGETVPI
jgi:signal transduction histidine kinase